MTLRKLKKSRQVRTCYECKCTINKGDQYGQRSVRLGGRLTQEEREASRPTGALKGMREAILVESITIRRDICANCS